MTEPVKNNDDKNDDLPQLSAEIASVNDNADSANDNAAPAAAAPAKKYGKGRKALGVAFNMAAGAAVTAGVKTAVVASLTWAAAPAAATLVISAAAVGVASAAFCHYGRVRAAKKAGLQAPKFFSRQSAKVFATSGGFALVGGALFLGFEEQIKGFFSNAWDWIKPASAELPPAPVAAPAPVCLSALERVQDIAAHADVSAQVQDALARSASTNAHVAAQATKDLAYHAYNGIGMEKNATLAVELFQKAAEAGNVQAKVDLLYLQHYGLAGVTADPASSAAQMAQIDNPRAESLAKAWGAVAQPGGKTAEFSAKAIAGTVKGVCLKS